jgi:hypothetical protein
MKTDQYRAVVRERVLTMSPPLTQGNSRGILLRKLSITACHPVTSTNGDVGSFRERELKITLIKHAERLPNMNG